MAGSGLLGIIGDIYRSGKQKDQEARIGELSKGIAMMPKSQRTSENIQRYLAGRNATDYEVKRIQDTLQKWADYRKTMAPPKPEYDQQTIYGPNGETKRISVKKGEPYTPPTNWSLTKPEIPETEYDQQTIYGPKGRTMRVSIKKGNKYTPPKGWSLKKPSEKVDKSDLSDQDKSRLKTIEDKMKPYLEILGKPDLYEKEEIDHANMRVMELEGDKENLLSKSEGATQPKAKSLGQITKEQALEELRRRGEIQ